MARHPFGGSTEDWIFAEDGGALILQGGAVLTFWNEREGGTQYTEITQDEAGETPITELRTSLGGDGYRVGQIPVFWGPPDVTTMWVSADGGERVAIDARNAGDVAAAALAAIGQHTVGGPNPHGTSLASLSDVQVGPPAARVSGQVVGWNGSAYVMLTPAQVSGALLLNPPLVGGVTYVGNIALPPPPGQNEPWLQMRQPYSAADTNPDSIQLYATHSDGSTPLKTFWTNGNNEARGAPSTPNRIGGRWFEFYEGRGGPSTGRFFELSTNPTVAANREALFGAYGTGHPTWPGWMVATRVLAGLLGVRAGGSYNGLTAVNFRGVRATTGAPTSGTWATNDFVLDSAGAPYLCTAGGTPGTWSGGGGGGGSAPTTFVDVTPGTNMTHGTKHAATRLERGGDAGRLRGTLTASAAVSSGATLANIPTTAHRPQAEVVTIARYTGGGAKLTITPTGNIILGSALTSGQEVWLDSITWDLAA